MTNDTGEVMDAVKAIYITMELIIAVCSIIGNILVIWAVKLNPGLQNTTCYFMVSLALADIAVGVLVVPLSIVLSLEVEAPFYSCLFMCCLQVVFTTASILSLLAIAIDRYLRIKISTKYRIIITARRICLALAISWVTSVLVGMVPMLGWNRKTEHDEGHLTTLKCGFISVMRMDYMVFFSFFGWVLLPLLIMLVLYIEIFYKIRKLVKKNAIKLRKRRAEGIFYGKEYKTAKSLALVLFLFALCWIPLSFMNCLDYFYPPVVQMHFFRPVMYFTILLSHSNSAMNPVVYAFKIRKFKETYIHILRAYVLHRSSHSVSSSSEDSLDQSDSFEYCLQITAKIKDVVELAALSVTCTYDPGYQDYVKYWCKGYYRTSCAVVRSTADSQSTGHVTIQDKRAEGELIITMSSVKKDDAGWYWCGIERHHLLDIMDYMHLTVSEAPLDTFEETKLHSAKIILPLVIVSLVMFLAAMAILIVMRRKKQKREADRNPQQVSSFNRVKAKQISNNPETFTKLPSNPVEDGVTYSSVVHHPSKFTTPCQFPVSTEYSTISYKQAV
ncbi:adenosine receptor A3 [Microcaecilia unicolor]|uniref:Adenosine receptor A3 n=1 Tax=Microcaecilia unicolor TaxID=1415580 RepID=A0A6P7ZDR2_9AMPH|nr:adenosine receptor A3-like [Microcaecilia unicolor]